MTRRKLPHLMIYLGFFTTAISVPKDVFFIHRFAYVVIVASICYFFIKNELVINKQITSSLMLLFMFSLFSVFNTSATLFLVTRTFAGLFAIHLALFSYFKYYKYDYRLILRHYIIIALISSYIGFIQEISYIADFVPGYNFSWILIGLKSQVIEDMSGRGPIMRIPSLFSEPGYFAAALTPAVFLAIHRLLTGCKSYLKKKDAVVILVALMLTFSTIGYLGLILSLLFNVSWKVVKKSFGAMVFISMLLLLVMSNVNFFQSRFSALWDSFIEGNLTGSENSSVLIISVHYNIAKDNFIKRPLIGSGFDSYKIVSQESIKTMHMNPGLEKFIAWMNPNNMMYEDGSTMYFRVITELGLFGIFLILWCLYRKRVRDQRSDSRLLQNMCIVFFLTYGLRTGQYIRFELWYFIGFYYCIKKYYTMNGPDGRTTFLTRIRPHGLSSSTSI